MEADKMLVGLNGSGFHLLCLGTGSHGPINVPFTFFKPFLKKKKRHETRE